MHDIRHCRIDNLTLSFGSAFDCVDHLIAPLLTTAALLYRESGKGQLLLDNNLNIFANRKLNLGVLVMKDKLGVGKLFEHLLPDRAPVVGQSKVVVSVSVANQIQIT